MSQPYFQQQNFIPQQTLITYDTKGFAAMGLDVAGSFSAGNFTLQGSNDGSTFTVLEVSKDGDLVASGLIASTGHYTVLFLGFAMVKVVPSTSPALSATITLTALGTNRVPSME